MQKLLIAFLLSSWVISSQAAWQLDNESSQLNFVSIKAHDVGENSRFRQLEGTIGDDGQVEIKINLGSIDTKVEVRDQRMQEHLFETTTYPQAILTAELAADKIEKLQVGQVITESISVHLDLHGITKLLAISVLVTRLSADKLLVVSQQPVIVNAADFDLAYGISKLQEIAKLPKISLAVPVTFSLTFMQEKKTSE